MLLQAILFVVCCGQLQSDNLEMYRDKAAEWEDEVTELVSKNHERVAGPNDLLFMGSSSIRLWDSIEEDMSGYSVVRRGYGGARYSDLAIYFDRLIDGHNPKALVIFVANDIAGNEERDIKPEEVGRLTRIIAEKARHKLPTTPIYFIEITPTPKRWHLWAAISNANEEIAKSAMSVDQCHFITTHAHFLDPKTSEPKAELFRDDLLHLNDAGYDLWAKAIQAGLQTEQ